MTPRAVLLCTSLAPGGAENQVLALARELPRFGWDVALVSLTEDVPAAPPCPAVSLGMRPGRPDPRGIARLVALLHQIRPQVLHSHLFHANLLARAARLLCPVPVVISTLHSMAETGRDSGRIRLRDLAYTLTDPMSVCTTAVCQAVADRHAQARAVPRRKLRIVPNGVDTSRFRPDPALRAGARARLGLDDRFVWLAAGRLMWKKDYPTLLRAFRDLAGAVLLIAGEGPQEAELQAMARELAIDARFLGAVREMPELLNAADGFVLSSVVEGLPMVLLEAAAGGLPVVATDVGGVRDIVRAGESGFVAPPRDLSALFGAMSCLMAMPFDARARMAEAARNRSLAFDLRSVAAQWDRLYRELLERAR